ncbi:uncharacterized protein EMH_0098430 [Eimeria mitis]|uniref:Uncharacterized protein n=1 Tax=Eimeria mitis TaxID=44415 RepID=U6KFV8_9EIME|nr:uncharacterized protein EMH_0098430 [Eimeria mitis]CDJ36910.1 hypothetical protein EMH_0098430 [Eimeria mitis]
MVLLLLLLLLQQQQQQHEIHLRMRDPGGENASMGAAEEEQQMYAQTPPLYTRKQPALLSPWTSCMQQQQQQQQQEQQEQEQEQGEERSKQ